MKSIFKMMLVAFMAITSIAGVNAQEHSFWGVRLALYCTVPDWDGVKMSSGAGVSVAGVYNMYLHSDFIYIEPTAGFAYNTWAYKNTDDIEIDDMKFRGVNNSFRYFGLRTACPVGLSFHVMKHATLQVFVGPEINFGFSNKFHVSAENVSISESAYGSDGILERFNLSCTTGVSLRFDQHYQVGLSASIPVTDIGKHDADYNNFRVALTLGYNF